MPNRQDTIDIEEGEKYYDEGRLSLSGRFERRTYNRLFLDTCFIFIL